MPPEPALANTSTVSKQRDSEQDLPDWDDWVRTSPLIASSCAQNSTTADPVHTQSNVEQSQTDQVGKEYSQQNTSKALPKETQQKTKAEEMAGGWRRKGGRAPETGPTDSTRKGG